jgi:hypothetical protein
MIKVRFTVAVKRSFFPGWDLIQFEEKLSERTEINTGLVAHYCAKRKIANALYVSHLLVGSVQIQKEALPIV